MERADLLTKLLLALIAAGLWVLILKPVLSPVTARAAAHEQTTQIVVPPEGLRFVTPDGRTLASLNSTRLSTLLFLYTTAGKPGILMETSPRGGEVRIRNAKGDTVIYMHPIVQGAALGVASGTGGSAMMGTDEDGGFVIASNNMGTTGARMAGISRGGYVAAYTSLPGNGSRLAALMGTSEYGGDLRVSNTNGTDVAALRAAEFGGEVSVSNSTGGEAAAMRVLSGAGRVTVSQKAAGWPRTAVAAMTADERGGDLHVSNNHGTEVAAMRACDEGGEMTIYDEEHHGLASLRKWTPPEER